MSGKLIDARGDRRVTGGGLKLDQKPGAHGVERGPQGLGNRSPGAHVHAPRIQSMAVHEEFVMQVRTGREAGGADVAARLSLLHSLVDAQTAGERREVAVAGADPVRVPQL